MEDVILPVEDVPHAAVVVEVELLPARTQILHLLTIRGVSGTFIFTLLVRLTDEGGRG